MPITFNTKIENDILKVTSGGICENLKQLKEYVLGIHEAVIAAGKTKVLVDETKLVFKLSTSETYESGCFLSQIVPIKAKLSVVCNPNGWETAKFWETVAVNRNVKVRIF